MCVKRIRWASDMFVEVIKKMTLAEHMSLFIGCVDAALTQAVTAGVNWSDLVSKASLYHHRYDSCSLIKSKIIEV